MNLQKGGDDISRLHVDNHPPNPDEISALKKMFRITSEETPLFSTSLLVELCFLSVLFLFLYFPASDHALAGMGVENAMMVILIKLVVFLGIFILFKKFFP